MPLYELTEEQAMWIRAELEIKGALNADNMFWLDLHASLENPINSDLIAKMEELKYKLSFLTDDVEEERLRGNDKISKCQDILRGKE